MAARSIENTQSGDNKGRKPLVVGKAQSILQRLCDECQRSVNDGENIFVRATAIPPSRTACAACSISKAAVGHHTRSISRDRPAEIEQVRINVASGEVDLIIGWHEELGRPMVCARYLIFTPLASTSVISPRIQAQSHPLRQFRIPSAHAGSNECVQVLKEWLRECLQLHQHPLCHQPETPLPTRVLDIGTPTAPRVRLWASGGVPGRYCALSHCWGSSGRNQPMTTTTETLATREAGIEEELLPKTFQDAVFLARRLDVGYLWIDSLCIIQDDHKDWEAQSAQMGAIFTNAVLVIAATHAAHGGEGFLSPRQQENITPFCCEIPLEHQDTEPSTPGSDRQNHAQTVSLHIRHCAGHVPFLRPWGLSDNRGFMERYYPLMTRAWCLQERILASRIVHYERDEMVWECRTTARCECTLVEQEISHGSRHAEPGSLLPVRWAKLSPQSTLAEVSAVWHDTMTALAELDITFPADRLPALSGLAKRLQSTHVRSLGRYMCGLWETSIFHDLTWLVSRSNHHFGVVRRADPWQAPTWSWTCLSSRSLQILNISQLELLGDSTRTQSHLFLRGVGPGLQTTPSGRPFTAKLLGFEQTLQGSDPTGAVLSASITISAPAIQLQVIGAPASLPEWYQPSWWIQRAGSGSECEPPPERLGILYPDCPQEDFSSSSDPVEVLCMWICSAWADPGSTNESPVENEKPSSVLLPYGRLLVVREVQGPAGPGTTTHDTDNSGSPLYCQRVGLACSNDDFASSDISRRRLLELYEHADVVTVTLV